MAMINRIAEALLVLGCYPLHIASSQASSLLEEPQP